MNGVNATDVIFIFHARSKQFLGHVSNIKGLLKLLKFDTENEKMKKIHNSQNENEQLCFDFGARDY